jgi:hypothetical protein
MLYEGKAAVRARAMSDAGQQSQDAVRVIEKGGYCGQSTTANCLASFASLVVISQRSFLLVFVPNLSNGVSFVCKQNCYRETSLKNETLFACFIFPRRRAHPPPAGHSGAESSDRRDSVHMR